MKRVFLFLAVFLTFIPSAFAGELVVEKFSGGLSREVSFMSEKAANKEFAGYTYTFKRSSGLATKSRKSIPFSGTVVAYFAPNHAVYVWAKGESKVITGYWGVFEASGQIQRILEICCALILQRQKRSTKFARLSSDTANTFTSVRKVTLSNCAKVGKCPKWSRSTTVV